MEIRRYGRGLMAGVFLAVIVAACAGTPVEPEPESESLAELIAFTSSPSEDEQNLVRDLFVIAPDGTGLTRLTTDLRAAAPAWSPDGRRLVFTSAIPGESKLFVINADGTGRRLLWDSFPGSARWSPDGDEILFSSGMEPAGLFLVPAEGGEPRSVYPCADCTSFAWSPDGGRIAVTRWDPDGHDGLGRNSIHIMDLDGGGSRALATGLPQESMPSWSPDGHTLVFAGVAPEDINPSIYRVRAEGTQLARVTDGDGLDWAPAFSRDGTEIVFESHRGGGTNLFVVALSGGEPHRLTALPGVHRSPVWRP